MPCCGPSPAATGPKRCCSWHLTLLLLLLNAWLRLLLQLLLHLLLLLLHLCRLLLSYGSVRLLLLLRCRRCLLPPRMLLHPLWEHLFEGGISDVERQRLLSHPLLEDKMHDGDSQGLRTESWVGWVLKGFVQAGWMHQEGVLWLAECNSCNKRTCDTARVGTSRRPAEAHKFSVSRQAICQYERKWEDR